MSDDWKVGDLALCVDGAPYRYPNRRRALTAVELGRIYRVSDVFMNGVHLHILVDGESPHESPKWGRCGWDPNRFRKIKPDTHEPCEEEFRILLQLSKRRVKA